MSHGEVGLHTQQRRWKFFRRRELLLPTWRGWLLSLVLVCALTMVVAPRLHRFLSLTESRPGGVFVVEGWAPDYVLGLAVSEYRSNRYEKVYVTGVPVDYGGPLSHYKSYAAIGAATLVAMGMDSNVVQAVPAPGVPQDRTYTSAAALADWCREHGGLPKRINVLTEGPHARRSRLMFQFAFGDGVEVGIIAAQPLSYKPEKWWRYSAGVRTVIGELIGYIYARCFFTPKHEGALPPGESHNRPATGGAR